MLASRLPPPPLSVGVGAAGVRVWRRTS
jgi:hypothetical protein